MVRIGEFSIRVSGSIFFKIRGDDFMDKCWTINLSISYSYHIGTADERVEDEAVQKNCADSADIPAILVLGYCGKHCNQCPFL